MPEGVVIRNTAQPRCFKKIKIEKLPVMYRSNRKAWMTTDLMTEWLKKIDKQMKAQGRKILLFLDNAPSHPHLTFHNVKLAFLPANTTALAQPMDQGIIQTLKLKYRKRQLQYVFGQMDSTDKTGTDILKQISILDAIYWINGSWKEIEPSTIQRCFKKCGLSADLFVSGNGLVSDSGQCDVDEDEVPLSVLKMSKELFGVEFQELLNIDHSAPVCGTCDSESTMNWSNDAQTLLESLRGPSVEQVNEDNSDDDDDNCVNDTNLVSAVEAGTMIEKLKTYALQCGHDKMLGNIMELQEFFIASRTELSSKQAKICDFFCKK